MCDKKIYADYNATTPLEPGVVSIVNDAMNSSWANPNSSHEQGKQARKVIDEARVAVATMVGGNSREIIFVSGGTEANCMAIHSVLEHYKKWIASAVNNSFETKKPHIITTLMEHDAIRLHLTRKFHREIDVTYLKAENLIQSVIDSIRPTTCLVTVMLANNETGVLFPIAEIAKSMTKINKTRRSEGFPHIFLHTDAAQAIGKVVVDVKELNVDYLTIVGHKFYGPRIGALYVRCSSDGAPVYPIFFGGGQERSLRAGTENTPMIAGLGEASRIVSKQLKHFANNMETTRNYLETRLKQTFGNSLKINCIEQCDVTNPDLCSELKDPMRNSTLSRLPNTLSISFYHSEVTGVEILKKCQVLLASTGAACNAVEDSMGVLGASGVCSYHARRTIRLSIGRYSTVKEMEYIVEDLKQAVAQITSIL